jgi:hypothetical protein
MATLQRGQATGKELAKMIVLFGVVTGPSPFKGTNAIRVAPKEGKVADFVIGRSNGLELLETDGTFQLKVGHDDAIYTIQKTKASQYEVHLLARAVTSEVGPIDTTIYTGESATYSLDQADNDGDHCFECWDGCGCEEE